MQQHISHLSVSVPKAIPLGILHLKNSGFDIRFEGGSGIMQGGGVASAQKIKFAVVKRLLPDPSTKGQAILPLENVWCKRPGAFSPTPAVLENHGIPAVQPILVGAASCLQCLFFRLVCHIADIGGAANNGGESFPRLGKHHHGEKRNAVEM